jgi:hypothetical protein
MGQNQKGWSYIIPYQRISNNSHLPHLHLTFAWNRRRSQAKPRNTKFSDGKVEALEWAHDCVSSKSQSRLDRSFLCTFGLKPCDTQFPWECRIGLRFQIQGTARSRAQNAWAWEELARVHPGRPKFARGFGGPPNTWNSRGRGTVWTGMVNFGVKASTGHDWIMRGGDKVREPKHTLCMIEVGMCLLYLVSGGRGPFNGWKWINGHSNGQERLRGHHERVPCFRVMALQFGQMYVKSLLRWVNFLGSEGGPFPLNYQHPLSNKTQFERSR